MTSSPLILVGYITLPEHKGSGGFDYADVHAATGNVYVAHTANDAVDVFDPDTAKHLFSIPHLAGAAGALVSDEGQIVISSNRGENTIGAFAPGPDPEVLKIPVGLRPNGLAYDPTRRLVLVANVGDPAIAGSHTLSMVRLDDRTVVEIPVRGRTRWAVFDPELFYVNIADPAVIVGSMRESPTSLPARLPFPQPALTASTSTAAPVACSVPATRGDSSRSMPGRARS